MEQGTLLILINSGTLGAIIIYGWKIVSFINELKFKTDLLWEDYEDRTKYRKYGGHS